MNPCRCGCGCLVEKNYKRGHGRRGRKNTPEHNQKIGRAVSLSLTGRKLSSEHIAKLRQRRATMETRLLQSRIARERGFGLWMKGRPVSEETRRRIGEAHRGHGTAEGTKEKISKANSGPGNGMYGCHHSVEARAAIGEASRRCWRDPSSGVRRWGRSEECRRHLREARKHLVTPLKDSKIEVLVAGWLREEGIPFRQHVQLDIPHTYQCDVLLSEDRTVIECDGDYWHKYPIGRPIDHLRTKELEVAGYRVIRLWEREIHAQGKTLLLSRLEQGDPEAA
jgi:very-short-patch-repair endonuclease